MAEPQLSRRPGPLPSAPQPEPSLPWPAMIASAIVLAIIIGIFAFANRGPKRQRNAGPPPYAAQLTFSNINFSQSENFVGGRVTYIEGNIANNGDRTVSGAAVELKFRNSLGELVQDDEQPLDILTRSGPYPQAIDARFAPLKPHQTEEFRFTFEHISDDWNRQPPEMTITSLSLQ